MNKPAEHGMNKAVDSIQQRLTSYACDLNYNHLTPETIHAAKARIIDTLGALIGGFFGEPCHISRNLASQMPNLDGATVIGTRMKTTPDMAAFVNGVTARYAELNDYYLGPGSVGGHPSDATAPVLSVAEHVQASGREFITSVVLAYEIFLRISDVFPNKDFDQSNFCCLATAMAAGKLLGLSPDQMSHCISMAIVPNNILKQVRTGGGGFSHFKGAVTGQAGRAGVFAALLARAGMEGPHLPFEGKAGWCNHISRKPISLDTMGGNGNSFKILDTLFKPRAACGTTISSILAAEKVAPVKNTQDIKRVTVEVFKFAKDGRATAENLWNPQSREDADQSLPYVVAAALMDGTVTTRQFNDTHLWNPDLRALMKKIEVVENPDFTMAYGQLPMMHRTRITVVTNSGKQLVGESGGDEDDAAAPMSDAQIEEKFRGLTEDLLGGRQVNLILARLWNLEDLGNVAEIPPAFVLD